MSDVNEVPQVDVDELARLHGEVSVLDVREPEEWVDGHVPGATHIPLAEVAARIGEVPSEGTVYVICHSGGRSQKAAEVLRAAGTDAVNVAGGTSAWIERGHPVETGL